VARKIGRLIDKVIGKRQRLGRPSSGGANLRFLLWTPQQDALALSLPAPRVTRLRGHPEGSVRKRGRQLLAQANGRLSATPAVSGTVQPG
jgi:hypothetical protein